MTNSIGITVKNLDHKFVSSKVIVEISELANGMYYVIINHGKNNYKNKLIKL